MIFLGTTFCAGRNSLDATATKINANINSKNIKLQNGIYDDIYISKNINREYSTIIPSVWDYDTILYAQFKGNLNAGNVDFILDTVSAFRIKRRLANTSEWITIHEFPITNINDLRFEKYDRYVQSNHTYEYLLAPIINGIEGNSYLKTATPKFDGIFLVDKENRYGTLLDITLDTQKFKPSNVINTIGRKYPYVVSNGLSNYYKGSVSGIFIQYQGDQLGFDIENALTYRKNLNEFLYNGEPKILKNEDGRAWMISIIGELDETVEGHKEKIRTKFNFVEIGDINSNMDLYNNNFIDVLV